MNCILIQNIWYNQSAITAWDQALYSFFLVNGADNHNRSVQIKICSGFVFYVWCRHNWTKLSIYMCVYIYTYIHIYIYVYTYIVFRNALHIKKGTRQPQWISYKVWWYSISNLLQLMLIIGWYLAHTYGQKNNWIHRS